MQRAVEELCRAIEPHCLSKSAQRPMPRGLQNTGNLCFMNSIMQVSRGSLAVTYMQGWSCLTSEICSHRSKSRLMCWADVL